MTEPNPESTGQRHARDDKGRWLKGQSGNPKGRPQGLRHKATMAAEALLDGQAEALTQQAVQLALEGDVTALRLCLERILPARKDRPITVELPAITTAQDVVHASTSLIQSVSDGALTPAEAGELSKLVESAAKSIELRDLEQRITELEKAK